MSPLELPAVGFGCSPPRGGTGAGGTGADGTAADLAPAVVAALALGYRLFDTAEAYGSEPLLGALLAGGRRGVAIVSKLWQTNHAKEHVRAACEGSLRRLRRDVLDLYLIHAPEAWAHVGALEVGDDRTREDLERQLVPRDGAGGVARADVPLEETWEAMLALRDAGLIGAVGLANVGVAELERLREASLEAPAAVQVELHPLRPQRELVDYCRRSGIAVMAHSPFGGGRLLTDARLRALAEAAGRPPAALTLGWHRARGVVPIVGACAPAHLRENLVAIGEPLNVELVAAVDALDALEGTIPPRATP